MTTIAAIPTVYKGIQFRSRLEAKWAAFFDSIRIFWEYEPLDMDGWIPDFLIRFELNSWLVEVKPILEFTPVVAEEMWASWIRSYPRDMSFYGVILLGLGPISDPLTPFSPRVGWMKDGADWHTVNVVKMYGEDRFSLFANKYGFLDQEEDIGYENVDLLGTEPINLLWASACNETQWRRP